jgi:hypothetical protein
MTLAACSSDEDELVENNDGRKLRQLTIAEVPVTKGAPTSMRVKFTENSSSLDASWTKEDVATYFNVSSFSSVTMDYGKLTAASSTRTSMFQGSVNCNTGDKVALLYPAENPILSGTDRGKFSISLDGQKGTLEDIADHFHYVYGVAEVTSVTEQTATATIDNMQSLLAVCKFSFTDGSVPIPVKTLTINYYDIDYAAPMGYSLTAKFTPTADVSSLSLTYAEQLTWDETPLSVTLDEETTNGVYVALFSFSPTGYMHFSVTGSSGTYTGIAKATLKAGRYYPVTLKLTRQQ